MAVSPSQPSLVTRAKTSFSTVHTAHSLAKVLPTHVNISFRHNIVLENSYRRTKPTLGQTTDLELAALKKVLDKRTINSTLLSLIILHNLPFRLVEGDAFHTFCKTLNPEATNIILLLTWGETFRGPSAGSFSRCFLSFPAC